MTIHEISKLSSPSGIFVFYNNKKYQISQINYIIDRVNLIDIDNNIIENILPSDLKEDEINNTEIQIGSLNRTYGIQGFTVANIGHPVFVNEENTRYIIYLTSINGEIKKKNLFYKETLSPFIDFL